MGPLRIVIPISVSHVQFKVVSRIVLNMVDTVPCIGGATVSLLDVPHVDFRLSMFNGPDIMALPGIRYATKAVIKVRRQLCCGNTSMCTWLHLTEPQIVCNSKQCRETVL